MALSFDSHNLESLFICGDPQFSILNSQPNFAKSSVNGSVFTGMKYGMSTVSFTIAATGTVSERHQKFSTLGAWLYVDSPKMLILPDTPDRYYHAVSQGALDVQRCFDGDYATLTFELTESMAYAISEESTPSENGKATFTIGGTAPTYVRVSSSEATPDEYESLWGVIADLTTSSYGPDVNGKISGQTVIIDSENRTFYNGYYTQPNLESDWLLLTPGKHTVTRNFGGGEFRVWWRNRWYF